MCVHCTKGQAEQQQETLQDQAGCVLDSLNRGGAGAGLDCVGRSRRRNAHAENHKRDELVQLSLCESSAVICEGSRIAAAFRDACTGRRGPQLPPGLIRHIAPELKIAIWAKGHYLTLRGHSQLPLVCITDVTKSMSGLMSSSDLLD